MGSAVLIEKSKRQGAARSYVPIGKNMTNHNRIMWFTRHYDAWFLYDDQVVWFERHSNTLGMFLRGNEKKGMESSIREDVSLAVGEDGAKILEALFSMNELVFINLSPRTPNVSRAVLAVGRKNWCFWGKIQPRIFAVLAEVGFTVEEK